jgi:DNA-binding XRE family transcriptional regulator
MWQYDLGFGRVADVIDREGGNMEALQMARPEWSIGDLSHKARKDADLDQGQLAERVGVRQATVSKWENDQAVPRLRYLGRIAKACDAPWILDLSRVQAIR